MDDDDTGDKGTTGIFAEADVTFESMGIQSKVLLDRLEKLGHARRSKL